jgi:hypothetical protein
MDDNEMLRPADGLLGAHDGCRSRVGCPWMMQMRTIPNFALLRLWLIGRLAIF